MFATLLCHSGQIEVTLPILQLHTVGFDRPRRKKRGTTSPSNSRRERSITPLSTETDDGSDGPCTTHEHVTCSLLLVQGDIACFPNTSKTDELVMTALGDCSDAEHLNANCEFLKRNSISGLFRIDETPIRAFILQFFHLDEGVSPDASTPSFWRRLNRWAHCDLTLHGLGSPAVLNYSAYHKMYHGSYRWLTCGTWVVAALVFVSNLGSFRFVDLRLIVATFFVSPFAVAVLEVLYQTCYVARLLAFWRRLTVPLPPLSHLGAHSLPPRERRPRGTPPPPRKPPRLVGLCARLQRSIPTTPLLALPFCTNVNVASKNVVCRDYPSVGPGVSSHAGRHHLHRRTQGTRQWVCAGSHTQKPPSPRRRSSSPSSRRPSGSRGAS